MFSLDNSQVWIGKGLTISEYSVAAIQSLRCLLLKDFLLPINYNKLFDWSWNGTDARSSFAVVITWTIAGH